MQGVAGISPTTFQGQALSRCALTWVYSFLGYRSYVYLYKVWLNPSGKSQDLSGQHPVWLLPLKI